MQKFALLLAGLTSLAFSQALANDQPRGSLLELHSCEVYAGPCVINSESCSGGRYMLRAWNFSGGQFAGSDLAGLRVALLQSSRANLAADSTHADNAVIYLPSGATEKQRAALSSWLKTEVADLKDAKVTSRVVPLNFARNATGYAFSAGKDVTVATGSRETCAAGACGEMLWYTPRTASTVFTVVLNQSSQVFEPSLNLKWQDFGKRSVFLARFGEESPAQNSYVSTTDLCGPGNQLF
jgi:hypothetical protein